MHRTDSKSPATQFWDSTSSRPHRSFERPPAMEDAGLRKERQELRRKRTFREVRRRPLTNWGYENSCVSEWLVWSTQIVWGIWAWALHAAGGVFGTIVGAVVPHTESTAGECYATSPVKMEEKADDVVVDIDESQQSDDKVVLALPQKTEGTAADSFVACPAHIEAVEDYSHSSQLIEIVSKENEFPNKEAVSKNEIYIKQDVPSSEEVLPNTSTVDLLGSLEEEQSFNLPSISFGLSETVPFIDDEEISSPSSDPVLEAVKGFSSLQSEMMQAIQEAKVASTSLSNRPRCNSFSSVTSGESLPSLASLDKFLASNSRCPSSSAPSTRNPSPSSRTQLAAYLRQQQVDLGQSPGIMPYDHCLEDDFESSLARLSDSEDESSVHSTVRKGANEIDGVSLSFDKSFFNSKENEWSNYSDTPQEICEAHLKWPLNAPPRPNSLDLLQSCSKRNLALDSSSFKPSVKSSEKAFIAFTDQNREETPVTPCVVVTETDANSDVATSYETINEDFLPPGDRLLGIKSDSSGSGEGGRTWHDLSSSSPSSDLDYKHPTPLSSPSSPVSDLPPFPLPAPSLPPPVAVPSKIDISALKGEIMALKKEIASRKGLPPQQKDSSDELFFVSSVEDISCLKNEITSLKNDFLSLLDENAKSSLKAACKKQPKMKYAGKALSIDSVDGIFGPRTPCFDKMSSFDKVPGEEETSDLMFHKSTTKSKWSSDEHQLDPKLPEVWFTSPHMKLSKGFLTKSKLAEHEFSKSSPLFSPIAHQLPSRTCALPSTPTNEQFTVSTLRRLTLALQVSSSDSEEDEVEEERRQLSPHEDSSDDGFASDDDDLEVELPCSVERVLYGLERAPSVYRGCRKRWVLSFPLPVSSSLRWW